MNTRLASLLAVIVLGAGCKVDNGFSIEPVGVCAPSTDAKTCGSSGSCALFQAGQGYFYLRSDINGTVLQAGDLGYFMQFDNQNPDSSDIGTGRVSTTDAVIDGVALSFTVHASAATAAFALPATIASTFPTIVRSKSTGTPFVILIPASYVAGLATSIAAGDEVLIDITVRGRGKYADQTRFETASLTLPVWVINRTFPGYVCDTAGATVTDICPGPGQAGATFACSGAAAAGGTFTIGGTVSGLTGSGLVLRAPGLSDLPVPAGSTTFQFTTGLADATAYTVTVATQPTGQSCSVTGGSGTVAGANVSTIHVNCI